MHTFGSSDVWVLFENLLDRRQTFTNIVPCILRIASQLLQSAMEVFFSSLPKVLLFVRSHEIVCLEQNNPCKVHDNSIEGPCIKEFVDANIGFAVEQARFIRILSIEIERYLPRILDYRTGVRINNYWDGRSLIFFFFFAKSDTRSSAR